MRTRRLARIAVSLCAAVSLAATSLILVSCGTSDDTSVQFGSSNGPGSPGGQGGTPGPGDGTPSPGSGGGTPGEPGGGGPPAPGGTPGSGGGGSAMAGGIPAALPATPGGGGSPIKRPPLPPPAALCGPDKWFGDLKDFIRRLGSVPIPGSQINDTLGLYFESPFAPLVSAPMTVLGGFKDAYGQIAKNIPGGDCPGITGDPHVLTTDGLRYDFQTTGEYVALRSASGDVEVQVRLAPVGQGRLVSVTRGVAARVDGRVLVVDESADPKVTVDGRAFDAPGLLRTKGGAYLLRDDAAVSVVWPDVATTIPVTGIGRTLVNLHATLDPARAGKTTGLLGNFDGDRPNDLTLPDGTQATDDFDSIDGAFGSAWRVDGKDSLFPGPSTFDAGYPSATIKITSSQRSAARRRCIAAGVVAPGPLENCTTDVALAGDDYAAHYAADQPARVVAGAGCKTDVGTLVSTEGFDPGRTYDTDAPLIAGTLDWQLKLGDARRPFVKAVAPSRNGLFVVDTRNGFEVVGRDGHVASTIEGLALPTVPTVTTGRVFAATTEGLTALPTDGRAACWGLVGYPGEKFGTIGLSGGRLLVTSTVGPAHVILALDPRTGFDDLVTHVLGWIVAARGRRRGRRRRAQQEPDRARRRHGQDALDADVRVLGLQRRHRRSGRLFRRSQRGSDGTRFRNRRAALDLQPEWRRLHHVSRRGRGRAAMVNSRYAYGIDLSDGKLVWTLGTDTPGMFSQPVIAGDVVYFIRANRGLVAHDLQTGAERLHVALPQPWRQQHYPVPIGDRVVVFDWASAGAMRVYR